MIIEGAGIITEEYMVTDKGESMIQAKALPQAIQDWLRRICEKGKESGNGKS